MRPPVVMAIVPAKPEREKGTLFCFAPPCADTLMPACAAPENGQKRLILLFWTYTG